MAVLIPFELCFQEAANVFFAACFPESGRVFEPGGRHCALTALEKTYADGGCWCLIEHNEVIGTVAVKPLSANACELKTLYLYARFQGRGFGRLLLSQALAYARQSGFRRMYLDTIRTSERAVALYLAAGFQETKRYNQNLHADLFFEKDLTVPDRL